MDMRETYTVTASEYRDCRADFLSISKMLRKLSMIDSKRNGQIDLAGLLRNLTSKMFLISFLGIFVFNIASCEKEKDTILVDNSDSLALDSIRSTATLIDVWDEIYITAYARGENLSYSWKTDHGSMVGIDSAMVKYWACPSCSGANTVFCEVSNQYGTVAGEIVITVNPYNETKTRKE